jgi:hypothetical protein
MLGELVSCALVALYIWIAMFAIRARWGEAPVPRARVRCVFPRQQRPVAEQWHAVGKLPTGRIDALRLQVVIA